MKKWFLLPMLLVVLFITGCPDRPPIGGTIIISPNKTVNVTNYYTNNYVGSNITGSGCNDVNNVALFYNETHLICNSTPILSGYDNSWINDTIHTQIELNNITINDFILYVNGTAATLDDYCNTDGKILKRIAGVWQCADDATGDTIIGTAMNYTKVVSADQEHITLEITI